MTSQGSIERAEATKKDPRRRYDYSGEDADTALAHSPRRTAAGFLATPPTEEGLVWELPGYSFLTTA